MPAGWQNRIYENASKNKTEVDFRKFSKTQFLYYRDTAEMFLRKSIYTCAEKEFTKALYMKPDDVNCLIGRSIAYMMQSNLKDSLTDAEKACQYGPNNTKALIQRGEILYRQAKLEEALVYFHRAFKLTNFCEEALEGIHRSEILIDRYFSTSQLAQFTNIMNTTESSKDQEQATLKKRKSNEVANHLDSLKTHIQNYTTVRSDEKETHEVIVAIDSTIANIRQNTDLLTLVDNHDFQTRKKRQQLVNFGREQIMDYLDCCMENIHDRYWHEHYDEVLRLCHNYLHEEKFVFALAIGAKPCKSVPSELELLELKTKLKALIFHYMGNSHMFKKNLTQSFECHELDLALSHRIFDYFGICRASDSLVMLLAMRGDYDSAIEILTTRLKLTDDTKESFWIINQLCYCYYQNKNYDEAYKLSEKSYRMSKEMADLPSEFKCVVLQGLIAHKSRFYFMAETKFLRGCELAQKVKNMRAEEILSKMVVDVRTPKYGERD